MRRNSVAGRAPAASRRAPRSRADQRQSLWLIFALIITILAADQVLKFWVKTSFTLGQEVLLLGQWARLHFTENSGIAFGISPSNEWGKLLLSIFRIIAAIALIILIRYALRRRDVPRGVTLALAAILAGALGNIIDGTLYGILFSSSEPTLMPDGFYALLPATFLPEGGGYAPLFHGKVVDMLYFPIIHTQWPDWIPYLGGKPFNFFEPVFNLADAAITTAVFYLLIFHFRFVFKGPSKQ